MGRAFVFWRPPKKIQSGGLVRSRPPLCIGPRGAMVHHAFQNFPKQARGVSIFEASKKIPKRGARSASPPALHRPAGGNGPPCFPKFSETRAGRRNFGSFQKKSKATAGGNGPPCFSIFSQNVCAPSSELSSFKLTCEILLRSFESRLLL